MLKSALIAKLTKDEKINKVENGKRKKSTSKSEKRVPKSAKVKPKTAGKLEPIKDDTLDEEIVDSGTKFRAVPKTPKVKAKTAGKLKPTNEDTFDEEILELGTKFRVDPNCVKTGVASLIKLTSENPKLKNQLFEDEHFPLFLQINSIKVPKGYPRIIRIPLKHSLLTPDSEVCLIVADVKGIANKKHEEHLEHYEKLLHQRGVDNIKKIMTFHEFRTEYETFELKKRLVELYDAFLVDGKISGKTVSKCGKIFYKKRKVPSAVKLRATKLKEHIQQTLSKSPLYLHSKGDSFMVQVGHSKMNVKEIVENAFSIMQGLEKEFPGGFANIRSLNLYTFRGVTIPIYTTLKNNKDIDLSLNLKKVPKNETVSGELTTRLNSGVKVKSTGEVDVYKLEDSMINKGSDNLKLKKKRKSDSNSQDLKLKKKKSD